MVFCISIMLDEHTVHGHWYTTAGDIVGKRCEDFVNHRDLFRVQVQVSSMQVRDKSRVEVEIGHESDSSLSHGLEYFKPDQMCICLLCMCENRAVLKASPLPHPGYLL